MIGGIGRTDEAVPPPEPATAAAEDRADPAVLDAGPEWLTDAAVWIVC